MRKWLLLLLLLSATVVRAQYNMLFTSDYDLPNSLINKVTEDSQGMLWIATEDGVCRFNGSRFANYRHQEGNPNSLANNFVRSTYTHNSGDVLVGSIGGVQIYRPFTNDFSEPLVSSKDGIKAENINDIASSRDGGVLVFGSTCFTARKVNGEWIAEKNVLTDKITYVHRGAQTADGSIWTVKIGEDVVCVSPNGKMRKVRGENGEMCKATTFCIGPDNKLYIGTADNGVYVYAQDKDAFHHIAGTDSLKAVYDIDVIPGTSTICIATDGTGMKIIDCNTWRFVDTYRFEDPMIDMSRQKVHALYINKNGEIWSGLYQKGIFMTTHYQTVFGYIGHRSPLYDLIGDRCVISLFQTHDGNIWCTTDNGGLFGFTSGLVSLRKYPCNVRKDSNGVPTTMIGLYEDSKNRVWFGSYNHGGGRINLETGECTYIPLKDVSGSEYSIYSYAEDKRGQMWVASLGKGVLLYDEAQQMYMPCKTDDGCQWSNVIFYDKAHDRIYCGTYTGLVSFPATDPKKSKVIENDAVVYALSYVSDKQIAAATNKGLILLDTDTEKFQLLSTEQGLPSDNVYDAKMGNDGHLWISSCQGLTRLNINNMTTQTYTMRDGLQGNEFYKNTGLVTKDGRLLFGGVNGITVFSPRDVDKSQNSCIVRVVDVRADEVYTMPNEDGEYIIPDDGNTITVSFGTLPLSMTRRVTYSYSIDGDEWVILPAPQNRVVIDNLGYGGHTLLVKTTTDGKDSKITETKIYVKHPWYLKWWVVIIWMILLGVLIYYIYVNLNRRHRMRDKLRKQMREQEIKETKLQFFMNVVHDLRTPLTLITTPLQKLLANESDSSRLRIYGIMKRNADRLLNLTNEIMDLRKLDTGNMELNLHMGIISKSIRNAVSEMEDIVQTRNQKITMIDHTDANQKIPVDYQAFDKIISNLLSNAVKYTPEGGQITVEWDIVTEGHESAMANGQWPETKITVPYLIFSVTDNGMGIPDEEKKRVFERFYQIRVNDKHINGTGIGLNLVKHLVDLHNGEITVTDNPEGQGTRFTVVIPTDVKVDVEDAEVLDAPEVQEDQEEKEAMAAQVATVRSNMRTVLVVDDDDDIRNFLSEELSAIYNVLEAVDGKAAFDVLNKKKVDIIVSDVMMPGIDGIELTKLIRKNVRLSHLPVILLTAKASDQDRLEGLQATADAYVAKPFNLELLETLIGNLIMRQEKLKNTYKGNELPTDRIETPEVQSADDKLMERLVKVINENLDNPDLTSEMLAREVGLSRVHMYRKLKELTNQSATNYIRNIRLTKAAELLRQGNATVSEVAYLVGFRTLAHFSSAFKELYGLSPKEYMKKGE